MAKKKRTKKANPIARALFSSSLYSQKVVADRTKFKRKRKHAKAGYLD